MNVSFIKKQRHVKRQFIVSGIYNTGLEEYDSKIALVDIQMIRSLLGWQDDEVGNIEVVVEDKSDMDIITEYLYLEMIPPNLYAKSIQERFSEYFRVVKTTRNE